MLVQIGPDDGGDYRAFAYPSAIRHAIDGALSMHWMALPANDRSIAAVRGRGTKVFDEAIAWWRRQDAAPERRAVTDASEGLNLKAAALPLSEDFARLALRNAVMTCWMLLPEHRNDDAEVERVVRLLLHETFDTLARDARLFDHPAAS